MSAVTDRIRKANPVPDETRFVEEWVGIDTVLRAAIEERKTDAVLEARPARWRRGLVAAALAAAIVVLAIGLPALLGPGDGGLPAGSIPPPTTNAPATNVSPTSAPTTVVESQPSATLPTVVPLDLEAAALDAIAGAGTMLVHHTTSGRDPDFGTARPDDSPNHLLTFQDLDAVQHDLYLDLAPLPETRLRDGGVWLGAFPDAPQAAAFVAQVTAPESGWSRLPVSDFDVPGIDGAHGSVYRLQTGRGGPSSNPNATIWFRVDSVVIGVDISFGGEFLTDEWPIEHVIHLAMWVHSSVSAQFTGQQVSGPAAPVAPPPSEYELGAVVLLEGFYRAIVSGDMDSAWALVGDIGTPGAGCGEGCQAANWAMNVKAPVFAAMLDPFDATADSLGCSATSTETVELYPGDDREGVDVRCLFQISGDPWLDALGINHLVEIAGLVVPGEPIVNVPSIPEHPGNRSTEYALLMLARHAGGPDPETLASACVFDPENPDEVDAWSVNTESPLRHPLDGVCREFLGNFDDIAIPIVP